MRHVGISNLAYIHWLLKSRVHRGEAFHFPLNRTAPGRLGRAGMGVGTDGNSTSSERCLFGPQSIICAAHFNEACHLLLSLAIIDAVAQQTLLDAMYEGRNLTWPVPKNQTGFAKEDSS